MILTNARSLVICREAVMSRSQLDLQYATFPGREVAAVIAPTGFPNPLLAAFWFKGISLDCSGGARLDYPLAPMGTHHVSLNWRRFLFATAGGKLTACRHLDCGMMLTNGVFQLNLQCATFAGRDMKQEN
ncbi:unnamed protein product [Effrenium voratum]|uniref:Uncharacterized protein n=1 Tax=Effrenium voratum TaxID=2562239 RepID=A0AA36I423_9DINO|nr:unnamed protein product [Effrenium voratum]